MTMRSILARRRFSAGGPRTAQTTYLGNVLHHLPGAFVLASPFVLAGTSALQNLFWLPLFFLAVAKEADSRTGGAVGVARPRAQPCGHARSRYRHGVCVQHHLRSARLVVAGPNEAPRPRGDRLGCDAGVASELSVARAVGVRLPPPTRRSANGASRDSADLCDDGAASSVPFYLHDRRHFGPLEAADRLLVFNRLLPHLGLALVVLMAVLAVSSVVHADESRRRSFETARWSRRFPWSPASC